MCLFHDLQESITVYLRGDCKVEFIQSFCWLYSVPNLLVIQHLETMYLGGNYVRMCVRECEEISEVCNLKESCDWISQLACDWQIARMAHV